MILLVDNYDSFTFNLRRYLVQLGQDVTVIRNDQQTCLCVAAEQAEAILMSPGPKAPSSAGYSIELVRRFFAQVPMLGVRLRWRSIGFQYRENPSLPRRDATVRRGRGR